MDQLLESVGDDKVLTDEDFDMIFSTTASDLNLSDDVDSGFLSFFSFSFLFFFFFFFFFEKKIRK